MDQTVCCYRHPDRETGIRCTRCERPICTECMIGASVGFHCPDCVREGGRTTPRPRTVAGGAVAADPQLVTKVLIGLNLVVFAAVLAVGDRLVDALMMVGLAFDPAAQQVIGVAEGPGQWYRMLTAVFLHQDLWHIGFNMFSLWIVGGPLEAALGRARYIALYLVSGLGGSALVLLFAEPNAGALGASGAVFGLFGATAVLMRSRGHDMRPIMILLALNLVFTFTWANISWQGHIGGLAAGTLIAVGMAYAPSGRRAAVQWGTCAVVLTGVILASWAGVAQITG